MDAGMDAGMDTGWMVKGQQMCRWKDTWCSELCLSLLKYPHRHTKSSQIRRCNDNVLTWLVPFTKGSVSLFWTGFWTLASGKAKKICLKSYFPNIQA